MINAPDILLLVLKQFLTAAWWMIPLLLIIGITKSAWFKGAIGEWLVNRVTRWTLPAYSYKHFNDVTLETNDGTTQIDHIIVGRYGVFCIETKNMKGWIYGKTKDRQWTQKFYRKSFKFQNPLRQNYKHVKTLESMLKLPKNTVHSIVVFAGEATLKSDMPENVIYARRLSGYIKSFKKTVLSDTDIEKICETIETKRLDPGWGTNRRHVHNLKRRMGASTRVR